MITENQYGKICEETYISSNLRKRMMKRRMDDMKKWEYQVSRVETDRYAFHERIAWFGLNGWELVCIYEGMMYFKREIEP